MAWDRFSPECASTAGPFRRSGEFFVFTPEATREWLDELHARIRAAYEDLARYNALQR